MNDILSLENCRIEATTVMYRNRGDRWEKHYERTDVITAQQYLDSIEAGRWFKERGAREEVERSETVAGYLPVRIVSFDPYCLEKAVFDYRITPKGGAAQ